MKKFSFIAVLFIFLLSASVSSAQLRDKLQLVGTWQMVDSLGNPIRPETDMVFYKIITPETFTGVQCLKSKGIFVGTFMGTYSLENEVYTETICLTNPNGVKNIGAKCLFNTELKDGLLYIKGINNPFNEIWKKIDRLPEATAYTEAENVFNYFKNNQESSAVKYEGGDGTTMENAVVIKVANERDGVASEYAFVSKKFGQKNVDWKMISQSTSHKNNKVYDVLSIKLTKNGEEITLYFDITAFYGKM